MADTTGELSAEQQTALFDILTHKETYAEIEGFKTPGAIKKYGPPFQDDTSTTTSPVLQTLLSKFILKLPGLRDVSPDFWKVRVEELIQELAEAELSESYDKGVLGIRKTLATAISALIEYPARGCLGGFPKEEQFERKTSYDLGSAEDVLQAWQDCLQALIYGDLIEEMFRMAAETDDLKKHDSLVQGMHEFVVVNIASLMHYTLVLSPEGPTLLRMIESVHRLLPYVVVRQTLKIGNVASMISAMMKVLLAKASVGAVTNWIGWSSGADEGMNLLQQIISQVLSWDKRDLRNRAEKLEKKGSDAPPKAVREALKDWIQKSGRPEHEECRRMSKEQGRSIVAVILSLSSGPSADDITEKQHANALEWFGFQLSIRDRQEIVRVLCQRNPDHLTAAIQDCVAAYTPMIRLVHQAVNLADTVWDLERFVTDMLKMSKPTGPKGQEKPPAVEDYVDLLHRHQQSTHKFLHQVAKNGKEVTSWWYEYVRMAAAQFRAEAKPPPSETAVPSQTTNGNIHATLSNTFSSLPAEEQKAIKAELNAHSKYLHDLHTASATRISAVIKRTRSTPFGPGAYLARWQNLLDATPITPRERKNGAVRFGNNKGVREEGRKDLEGNEEGFLTEEEVEKAVGEGVLEAPSVQKSLEVFGERFREALGAG
ncbi:hypothetical protein LTR37_008748 [Vermiconidia calcicola]|uniref:Uncharacterized protein n=1 Tax=Vermiconidia calcicola TaxID=1690605 RepID=A0ACC3NBC7_9PEZI|nr:hypothetical protein LTR37_008748 [Vermiconidia calcicola]